MDIDQIMAMGRASRRTAYRDLGEIAEALPPNTRTYLERIGNRFGAQEVNGHPYHRFNLLAGQIHRAVVRRITLEISYRGMKGKTHDRRRIDPYHLWFKNGAIYLVARCHRKKTEQIFALDQYPEPVRACEELQAIVLQGSQAGLWEEDTQNGPPP